MVAPMSAELIGILAVGVALCGVIIAGQRRLEGRYERGMAALEGRLESRISALERRVEAVEHGLADLRERMARLEGLLDGLREAIVGRARQNAAE
jgi:uncharacterized coiled-coil protein SlyX